MKKLSIALAAIIAAAGFVSCNKAEIEEVKTGSHSLTFVASNVDTKTSMTIDGGLALFSWEKTDENAFHIYEDATEGEVVGSLSDDMLTMTYLASFDGESAAQGVVYNAYLNSDITSQNPTESSYDTNADVLVAKPLGLADVAGKEGKIQLSLKRAVAVNKMTLKGLAPLAVVKAIKITSDIDIAGKYVKNEWTEKSKTINLTSEDLIADENGQVDVYFTCLPAERAMLTVEANTDCGPYKKVFLNPISFAEGAVKAFSVTVALSTANLVNDEIVSVMSSHTGTAKYDDFTVSSFYGDWSGNAYCSATAKYVQINKAPSRLVSPEYDYSVKGVKVTTTNSSPKGRTIYVVRGSLDATYSLSELSASILGSYTTASANEVVIIDFSQSVNQFSIIVDGGACYIASVEVTPGEIVTVNVTGVSLSESSLSLKEGETASLVATVAPETATNKNVTWSSTNESVAVVSQAGKVTAIGVGGATVKATTEDGSFDAECAVVVSEATERTVSFPFNVSVSGWPNSSASANAQVSADYDLDGVKYGFALSDGIYTNGSCLFVTKNKSLGLPVISGYRLAKVVGTLNGSGSPSTSSVIAITNNSDGSTIVPGGEGQTWAVKGGSYTYTLSETAAGTRYYIYATSANSQIINLELTYEKSNRAAQILSFAQSSYEIALGEAFTAPTVVGAQTPVTYSSSDIEVATVSDDGSVTLKATGQTVITANAQATDSFASCSASYTLVVKPAIIRTIEDLKKAITSDTQTNLSTFSANLTGATVTYANDNNAFIEDSTGGIMVFISNHGLTRGTTISGEITGSGYKYYGLYEITALTLTDQNKGTTQDIPCTTLTIAELKKSFDRYVSCRVRIEDVTATTGVSGSKQSGVISKDDSSVPVRTNADIVIPTNSTLSVVGYPSVYNTTEQVGLWETIQESDFTEYVTALDFGTTPSSIVVNSSATYAATANYTGATIVYSSSDPSKVSVDASTGEITGVAVTTEPVVITASVAASAPYTAASKTYSISVTDEEDDSATYTVLFGSQYNSKGVSSYTGSFSSTTDQFTVNLANFNNNNNGWDYVKTGNKTNAAVGTIITNSAISEPMKEVKIDITAVAAGSVNSIKLYSGASASAITTEEGSFTIAVGTQTVTISNPTSKRYYKISFDCQKASSNGVVTVSKVVFTNE